MTIGEATPPPPSEGTGPGGEIDTAVPGTEPPPPWTPPAHWPPMPAGVSPDGVARWIAAHRQADAIEQQTRALEAGTRASEKHADALASYVTEQFALAVFGACAATPLTPAQVRSRVKALLPEFHKLLLLTE